MVCCSRAPRVGGIASYGLCFLASTSSRASSTPSAVLDLSYIITTNFSSICRSSSSTVNGYWLSLAKTSDTSVYASQVSNADFFPLPRRADTTSHPVKCKEEQNLSSLCQANGETEFVHRYPPQVISLTKRNQSYWRPLCCRDLFCSVP